MTRKRTPSGVPITWITLADRARARTFECDWPIGDRFEEVDSLVHPEARMRESEVLSDNEGRFAERAGGQHNGEPQTDFQHRTANDFAIIIADRLDKARVSNRFGHLILIAPPLFLGVLRKTLSDPLAKLVELEVDKDYTQLSSRELTPVFQRLSKGIPAS